MELGLYMFMLQSSLVENISFEIALMFTPVAEHLICFATLFYNEKSWQHLRGDNGVSDARDHSHPSHDIPNMKHEL